MLVRPGMSTLTQPFPTFTMLWIEWPWLKHAQVTKASAAWYGFDTKIVSPYLVHFTIGVIKSPPFSRKILHPKLSIRRIVTSPPPRRSQPNIMQTIKCRYAFTGKKPIVNLFCECLQSFGTRRGMPNIVRSDLEDILPPDNYHLTRKNASFHLVIWHGHLWGEDFRCRRSRKARLPAGMAGNHQVEGYWYFLNMEGFWLGDNYQIIAAVRNRSCFFYRLWWVTYYFSLALFSSCQAVFDVALLFRER